MNIFALILLAFSMSIDAFAAAMCKGAALKQIRWREMVRTALIFGGMEMITPVIGWLLGRAAHSFIEAYDHWVAFILLLILGGRMIRDSLVHGDEEASDCGQPVKKNSLHVVLITALATSIDSMVVGISLAFLEVNVMLAAAMIGAATTLMVMVGMRLGGVLGSVVGNRAEMLGGVVLMGIGTFILLEHLGFLA